MSDRMTAAEYQEMFVKGRQVPKAKWSEKGKNVWVSKKKVDGNRVYIKPLSVNDAWKGRRKRSDEYNEYEQMLMDSQLPDIELPEPPYCIHFKFGFSSSASDWDNPIKPLQDILAKRYGFNDKLIKRGIVDVEDVKKGYEFIEFKIETLIR
mgnify:CR=1 FL=1